MQINQAEACKKRVDRNEGWKRTHFIVYSPLIDTPKIYSESKIWALIKASPAVKNSFKRNESQIISFYRFSFSIFFSLCSSHNVPLKNVSSPSFAYEKWEINYNVRFDKEYDFCRKLLDTVKHGENIIYYMRFFCFFPPNLLA